MSNKREPTTEWPPGSTLSPTDAPASVPNSVLHHDTANILSIHNHDDAHASLAAYICAGAAYATVTFLQHATDAHQHAHELQPQLLDAETCMWHIAACLVRVAGTVALCAQISSYLQPIAASRKLTDPHCTPDPHASDVQSSNYPALLFNDLLSSTGVI